MKRLTILLTILVGLSIAGCNLSASLSLPEPTSLPALQATATETLAPPPTLTPTITPTPIPAERIETGDQVQEIGDWESALSEYQSALQASPEAEIQNAARLGVGRIYLLSGDYGLAIQELEALIKNASNPSQLAQASFFLAQAYQAQENYQAAIQAYTNYLSLRPGIIDGYVLELRGDARMAAGDYLNAAQDFRTALQAGGLMDRTYLEMKEARSYALAGDYTSALARYDDLYQRISNESSKALIDLRRGQIYTDLGLIDKAYEVYLDAVNTYPAAYESYSALLALVEANVPVNELNRGLVDYFAGQYGVALAAFDRYLQDDPADPGTALYYSGLTHRALGGFDGAVGQWDKIIQNYPDHPYWDEAWEQKAYTQWYFMYQDAQAVQTLVDFVSTVPTHPRAAEFLFDAGRAAERSGDLAQAAELWERVANLYPGDSQTYRALFMAGISRYRTGDYATAFMTFQRLQGIANTTGELAQAYFWIAKSQLQLGDQAGARTSWESAAAADPTGYYSERARDILHNRAPFTPPDDYDLAINLDTERASAAAWVVEIFGLPAGTDLTGLGDLAGQPNIIRGNELWQLGQFDQARAEFEDIRMANQSDAARLFQLAGYFRQIGLYRSATLAARRVLDLAGMSDADTMNAPVYFNHLRFGTYYADLIIPAAQKYAFHPLFIFSLIRQESLFESFVRSSAAASGLMQIMPSTGADIARNMGWPENYTQADLSRPFVNITLGIDYLDTQRNAFNGDLYTALAAYNGGPGNALAWQKLSQNDPDLFLEIVRFSETQEYIRRVYEIFTIYRRLYNRTP